MTATSRTVLVKDLTGDELVALGFWREHLGFDLWDEPIITVYGPDGQVASEYDEVTLPDRRKAHSELSHLYHEQENQ